MTCTCRTYKLALSSVVFSFRSLAYSSFLLCAAIRVENGELVHCHKLFMYKGSTFPGYNLA